MLNLLTTPLIRIRRNGTGVESVTLPGLLHLIGTTDDDIDFVGLRPHQTHAWHAFLCQVAALALLAVNKSVPRDLTVDEWTQALQALATTPTTWDLVSTDTATPAFLQPPSPVVFNKTGASPDNIDILVTGRSWEVKAGTMLDAHPDQWIYALVTVQTTGGFEGLGLYGIYRHNSGYGSRTCLHLVPQEGGWAASLRRDTAMLVTATAATAKAHGYRLDGHRLLWEVSWSGTESLTMQDLHPWAVEICRLIRLQEASNGRLSYRYQISKTTRVSAKEAKGAVGDPWLPVEEGGEKGRRDSPTALTMQRDGYSVRQILTILASPLWVIPLCAHVHPTDAGQTLAMVGRGVGREQGGTLGVHETSYPLCAAFVTLWTSEQGRQVIRTAAQALDEDLKTIRRQILFPALKRTFEAANSQETGPQVDRWRDAFAPRVQNIIAPILSELLATDLEAARARWRTLLGNAASEHLREAMKHCPFGPGQRYPALAAADGIAGAALRSWNLTTSPLQLA